MNKQPNVCPCCGTDLIIEKEIFANDKLFTGHNCEGDAVSESAVWRALSALRVAGLHCFLADGRTTPELDAAIRGEG